MFYGITQVTEADDRDKRNDDLTMHLHDMLEMHDDAVIVNDDLGSIKTNG